MTKKLAEEIYKVVKVIKKFPRVLYQIATLDRQDEVIDSFYQEQMTKAVDQDKFTIEKVLKFTPKKAYVKFLGYDKPEWILRKILQLLKIQNNTELSELLKI